MATTKTIPLYDVLALVRVGRATLAGWIKRKSFPPPLNPTSSRRLWSADAVERWLAGEYAGGKPDARRE